MAEGEEVKVMDYELRGVTPPSQRTQPKACDEE